jgi:hypothetical protein
MLIQTHHDMRKAAVHGAPRWMRATRIHLRRAPIELRATMFASTEAGIGKVA